MAQEIPLFDPSLSAQKLRNKGLLAAGAPIPAHSRYDFGRLPPCPRGPAMGYTGHVVGGVGLVGVRGVAGRELGMHLHSLNMTRITQK